MRQLALLLLVPFAIFSHAPESRAAGRLRGHFEPVIADTDMSLYRVRMFKGGTIYICGSDGVLSRSEDGGKTWSADHVREGASLRAMVWLDERRGFFLGREAGKDLLLTTRNGGDSVSEKKLKLPFPAQDLAFTDARNGWMVAGSRKGKDGAWRVTDDGGQTWKERDSDAFRIPARVLTAITSHGTRLWAVGSHVQISLVGDAAKSFLYRTKKGSVLYSEDGGKSWEVRDAGNPEGVLLTDVDFVDENNGYVVGDAGFFAKTTDGGKTWTKLDSGTELGLRGVDAVSADVAFAVGEQGIAIGTSDGGKRVATFRTGTKKLLRSCSFLDDKTGYVVGRTGTVLRFKRDW